MIMNRYIKAMEIGNANEVEGISYFELVHYLFSTKEKVFTMNAEKTFCVWFMDNFSPFDPEYQSHTKFNASSDFRQFLIDNSKTPSYHARGSNPRIYDYLDQKWFLNGDASKQYIDYLELKESRIAATHARKQSNYSIRIAVGAILISTILGLASLLYQPEQAQPPFDVKVIEDKTGNKELEKKNKELKEKLYKAELFIRVLEGEQSETSL